MTPQNHVDMRHNLWQRIREQHSFLLERDVAELAELERLRPLLVRCGGCRFTCAAQDVKHLLGIIAREGSEYVRDVSLPATR